jgi:predicted acylesterase/phospholipase RssA
LLVGVVEFGSAEFLAVDMVALAGSEDPARYDCYRAVIGASSAIPLAFSPKIIDGKMFVDGGARSWMFIDHESLGAGARVGPRRVLAIVHGDLEVERREMKPSLLSIMGRTIDVSSDQLQKQVMYTLDWVVKDASARRKPGEFDISALYATAAKAASQCRDLHSAAYAKGGECAAGGWLGMEAMFCQPFMACLVERGRADGRDWTNVSDGPTVKPFRLAN